MRKYELMLILNPELTGEDKTALLKDINEELTAIVRVTGEDDWWVRNLAYKIKWSKVGHYLLLNLESDWGSFFEITKSFNIKKDIWRHMFVRKED